MNWFVKYWEDAIKGSHEVIFEQNIGTISSYFLELSKIKEIKEASKIESDYQVELLNILQNIIHNNEVETKILKRLVPSEICELGKKPTQPSTKLYIEYFKKINEAYSDPKFVESVKIQMLEALDSHKNTGVINECMKYLTRSLLLRRYSKEYLKEEIPKILAKSFFELHDRAIRDKVTSSSKLRLEQPILLNRLYKKAHEKSGAFSSDQKREEYLNRLHSNSTRNDRDMFFIISNAKKMMRNEKIPHSEWSDDSISASSIYTILNQQPLRNIFHTITVETCFKFIFNIVSEPLDKQRNDFGHDMMELEFCREFSNLVKSVIYPNNESPYVKFNHDISSFSNQIFSETYSRIIQTKISETKLETLTTKLIRQISIFFATELRNGGVDILNKFELNRIITEHARNVCYDIFEDALATMQNTPQEPTISQIEQSFTNDLLDRFFDKMDRLPLTCDLTKSQMRRVVISLCNKLQEPTENFRVYCLLGNLDCNQKRFQIEHVTFYDARTWDFGENVTFDRTMGISDLQTKYGDPYDAHDDNSRRNSARAVVDVEAHDYQSAINKAEIKVQKSLNPLVYASTAFTEHGGFKPEIPARYMVILNDGESARVATRRDHHPLVIDDKHLEISKFYSKLILEPSTKLNDSLILAFEWYNRGHWSEITRQKFVLLWIALDQLIHGSLPVKKSESKNLLEYIPKLIATWRDNNYNFSLLQRFRAMMEIIQDEPELQAHLDSNPKFKGWRQNNGIVLENLNDVALLANSNVSNYANSISKELTPVYIKNVENIIKAIRKHILFKVDLLRLKRNSLIHEGVTRAEELDIMTKGLEKILTDVIYTLIQFRDKRELAKIIDEINRPFHVHD